MERKNMRIGIQQEACHLRGWRIEQGGGKKPMLEKIVQLSREGGVGGGKLLLMKPCQ